MMTKAQSDIARLRAKYIPAVTEFHDIDVVAKNPLDVHVDGDSDECIVTIRLAPAGFSVNDGGKTLASALVHEAKRRGIIINRRKEPLPSGSLVGMLCDAYHVMSVSLESDTAFYVGLMDAISDWSIVVCFSVAQHGCVYASSNGIIAFPMANGCSLGECAVVVHTDNYDDLCRGMRHFLRAIGCESVMSLSIESPEQCSGACFALTDIIDSSGSVSLPNYRDLCTSLILSARLNATTLSRVCSADCSSLLFYSGLSRMDYLLAVEEAISTYKAAASRGDGAACSHASLVSTAAGYYLCSFAAPFRYVPVNNILFPHQFLFSPISHLTVR